MTTIDTRTMKDTTYLTDGGLETCLILHDGIELPHFAAFPLIESESGQRTLRRYYRRYVELDAALPNLRVLGGCCGTDHRHVEAMGSGALAARSC